MFNQNSLNLNYIKRSFLLLHTFHASVVNKKRSYEDACIQDDVGASFRCGDETDEKGDVSTHVSFPHGQQCAAHTAMRIAN